MVGDLFGGLVWCGLCFGGCFDWWLACLFDVGVCLVWLLRYCFVFLCLLFVWLLYKLFVLVFECVVLYWLCLVCVFC